MALCRSANCHSCERRRRNSLYTWAAPEAPSERAYLPPPASRVRHSMEPVLGHVSAILPGGALVAIDADAAGELGVTVDVLPCLEDLPTIAVGDRVLFHVVKDGDEWEAEEMALAPRDRSRSPLRALENTERPLSR